MASQRRDLFANFDRMRRDMDELFGDLWNRPALKPRRARGFSPSVDVYYCGGDAPRAVVKVDLAGLALEDVNLEIRGRQLVISGGRPVQETEGRIYQQLEIATGPFRRVVELGADVKADEAKATYEQGVLRIELPLRADREPRQVPIDRGEE